MPSPSFDPWELVFFAGAFLLIALQTFRGWRLGIVRQVVDILGVMGAYVASYVIGPKLAPLLSPMGLPRQVLAGVAGSVVGVCVYVGFGIAGAILFKRTAQQRFGIVRLGFGASGAILGAAFGLFMVWLMTLGIRLCGSLAESRVRIDTAQSAGHAVYRAELTPDRPGWMRGLVAIKRVLETGTTGQVMKQVDPIPAALYSTIGRVGEMLSSPQSVERFLSYPGIKPLAEHPKLMALREDPQIIEDVQNSNYVGLLHNPHVVAAANDAEIAAMLKRLDVEKALDYALGKAEKPRTTQPMR